MNHSYDFRDIAPSLDTIVGAGFRTANHASNNPQIVYTPGVAVTVEDNATFFGANF